MLELWNLMDTPIEEQQVFQSVTCNIASSEHEITEPNMLSVDFINYVSFSFKHKPSDLLFCYWKHIYFFIGTDRRVNLLCRLRQKFLGWKS